MGKTIRKNGRRPRRTIKKMNGGRRRRTIKKMNGRRRRRTMKGGVDLYLFSEYDDFAREQRKLREEKERETKKSKIDA